MTGTLGIELSSTTITTRGENMSRKYGISLVMRPFAKRTTCLEPATFGLETALGVGRRSRPRQVSPASRELLSLRLPLVCR